MKNLLIVFFLLYNLTSCIDLAEHRYSIILKNNTSENIKFYSNFNYSDTLLDISIPVLRTVQSSNQFHNDSRKKWEEVLVSPNDTISFFFFQEKIVSELPWDSIRSNYMVLARYDLSLQDLQHRNFIIEYPYDPKLGKLKVYQKLE